MLVRHERHRLTLSASRQLGDLVQCHGHCYVVIASVIALIGVVAPGVAEGSEELGRNADACTSNVSHPMQGYVESF